MSISKEAGGGLKSIRDIWAAFLLGAPKLNAAIAGVGSAWKSGMSTMSKATGAFKAGLSGLGSILKEHPLLSTAAIMAGVISVYQQSIVTAEEAKEEMEDSVQKYKDTQSEISSINSELDTTQSQIEELQAQGPLSIAEQSELERLQDINEELLIQKGIKESMAEEDAKDAIRDTLTAYGKYSNLAYDEAGRNALYNEAVEAGPDANSESNAFVTWHALGGVYNTNSLLAQYSLFRKMRDEAEQGSEAWQKYNEHLDITRNALLGSGGTVSELVKFKENLSLIP